MKIINTMYHGDIEMTFETGRHRYTVDNKPVYGVTSVLGVIAKPGLLFWSANMAADHFRDQINPGQAYDEIELELIWKEAKKAHHTKKETAGSIGTLVHKWVEDYCNKKNPGMPVNKIAAGAVGRFLKWVNEHNIEFLSSEQPCYSKKYNYAGTIDGICKIDGKLYIFDLKTSNRMYDEMRIQVAAYKHARVEEFPEEKYEGCCILRVGKKDGDIEFKAFKDKKYYFQAFLNALRLTKNLKLIEEDKQ